ncbi:hypothetical protein GCM10022243_64620 [Saccharothrix violaceirubra]|uniref:LPXTG-motif cell wall-anchored protein n=1 Tax=Saccharothrix violaceirubra TaxID=413306 RepID=A0A7W7T9I6_9PSEU|nr:hypothetical protein [Saccharothrix violaceirubra]MBB4969052.1 hypothetical protein [Saccharothrix violaceirubra]
MLVRVAAVAALLLAGVPVVAAATPACATVTWDSPGLEWPQGVVGAEGTFDGLGVSAELVDPASRNGDDSNPLADFGETGVPGWPARPLTGTTGNGTMTLAMNSLSKGDSVRLTFFFSRPVVVSSFVVGGIDEVESDVPWLSYADKAVVSAWGAGEMVDVGETPTGYTTTGPVTALRVTYSNGEPDSAARPTIAFPAPPTALSAAQSITLSGFTACDPPPATERFLPESPAHDQTRPEPTTVAAATEPPPPATGTGVHPLPLVAALSALAVTTGAFFAYRRRP